MPPVRRHNEQLQLVALSGATGSVRRTAPQWQEPCSDGVGWSWFMGIYRRLLCRLTNRANRLRASGAQGAAGEQPVRARG